MSEISREQVAHLADLAHIDMTDAELDQMTADLSSMVTLFGSIGEVVSEDVPATSHPVPLTNVFRDDEESHVLTNEQAVAYAPDAEDGQFKVPAILDGE